MSLQPDPSIKPVSLATPMNANEPVAAASGDRKLTIITSRGGDGLGISLKVESTGRVFRIEPTRDPNQPRFWCFRVFRCTSAGVISQTDRSWWGPGGMTRADLPAAVDAIRTDPDRWLAGADLVELREWILAASDELNSTGSAANHRASALRAADNSQGKSA